MPPLDPEGGGAYYLEGKKLFLKKGSEKRKGGVRQAKLFVLPIACVKCNFSINFKNLRISFKIDATIFICLKLFLAFQKKKISQKIKKTTHKRCEN